MPSINIALEMVDNDALLVNKNKISLCILLFNVLISNLLLRVAMHGH